MKVSYNWLQEYLGKKLPSVKELSNSLTMHSYEVEDVLKTGDDYILDIDVLPNRAHDSLSHTGIAKEISTLLGIPFKFEVGEIKIKKGLKISDFSSLSIENPECRRAMKRLVVDVKVGESPEWLKEKLSKFDQRSINNIVDVTNFVTLETGQPVHAFDFDKLKGDISVRFAKEGENVTTLDEQYFDLDNEVLVISDFEKPLDIAGIKGGIDSGIDENTNRILLSVCNFDPKNIRRTSRRLKIETEASKRFEADITPEMTELAMERLTHLITKLSGGEASEDVLDVYIRKSNPRKIGVSLDEVNKLLGLNLEEKNLEKIFDKLKFEYNKVKPLDEIKNSIEEAKEKSYKYGASVSYDAPNEFDCSSLTSWFYVQGGISIPRISIDQYVWGDRIEESEIKFGDLIFSNSENGKIFYESIEFLKGTKVEKGIDHVGMYLGEGKVLHASRNNQKGIEVEDLNTSKSFQKIIGYGRYTNNEERYVVTVPYERLDLNIKEDLIEEIGRIYGYENIGSNYENRKEAVKKDKTFYYTNKIRDFFINRGFSEAYNYSFVEKGELELENPLASDKKFLRSNLKDGLEKSLEFNNRNKDLLALDEVKIFEIGKVFQKDEENLSLYFISSDKEEVTKGFLDEFGEDISKEVNLDSVIEKLPEIDSYEDLKDINPENKFKPISAYPVILRDLAVWVPGSLNENDILDLVKNESGELLVQSNLFDVYEKGERTSYAFHLVFQSQNKTLTDSEVGNIMKKVEYKLEEKGWEVR